MGGRAGAAHRLRPAVCENRLREAEGNLIRNVPRASISLCALALIRRRRLAKAPRPHHPQTTPMPPGSHHGGAHDARVCVQRCPRDSRRVRPDEP